MSPGSYPISITPRREGPWLVVDVAGDLDLGTADRLRDAVAAAAGNGDRLALDLSGIGFIDSSGLRVLLEFRQSGEAPVLISPSGAVTDLLEMTMMADAFPYAESAAELG